MPASRSRCAGSSIPSAITWSPRVSASRTMPSTRATCWVSRAMSSMNDLSIFSTSMGKSRRYRSEENPVPKSSTAIRTPSSLSACSTVWIWVSRRSSTVSVSSSWSEPGASPGVARARPTWSRKVLSRNCRAETLTLMNDGPSRVGASGWSPVKSRTAFSSTHAPSAAMCPVSSARPMNCSGSTGGRGAPGQRTSASKPTTCPAVMSTTGW